MATMGPALLFTSRLDGAERRLEDLARAGMPDGLTDPDPGGEERWEAGQVWAHIGEFPAYWTDQARRIVAADPETPAPVGRMTSDATRVGAIARDRYLSGDELLERARSGVDGARVFALGLGQADWDRVGIHPTRGEVTVGFILETFIAGHLEEHAKQLERLSSGG